MDSGLTPLGPAVTRQKRRHDWIEAYLVQHQRVAA
jgi:hypothetical protein